MRYYKTGVLYLEAEPIADVGVIEAVPFKTLSTAVHMILN